MSLIAESFFLEVQKYYRTSCVAGWQVNRHQQQRLQSSADGDKLSLQATRNHYIGLSSFSPLFLCLSLGFSSYPCLFLFSFLAIDLRTSLVFPSRILRSAFKTSRGNSERLLSQ